MIIRETVRGRFCKSYSDAGLKIRQIETGRIYASALDTSFDKYSYEETDELVEEAGAI